MKIDEWFHGLGNTAETIEEKWAHATLQERQQMADQLFYLRQISDHVVDLWLEFEERLSRAIRSIKRLEGQHAEELPEESHPEGQAYSAHTGALTAEAGLGEAKPETLKAETSKAETTAEAFGSVAPPYEHLFRRGEGFYHLRMYPDARACFAELVAASPDWEMGRLYYAYSLLFTEERELAMREFRLLGKSAASAEVTAISRNALGCMLAEEGQWLEAAQAFKAALEANAGNGTARYNLALCYLKEGDAREALEEIEAYLRDCPHDWEAQMLWLRAAHLLLKTDADQALLPPDSLKVPSREMDSSVLREMAALYEAAGSYHRAQLCYAFLAEALPREGWTWHGLAWNTWLITGTRRAATLMKKAISLNPHNLDFVFSYGWMQLFDGELDEAVNAFRRILEKQADHRLAQSGMISAYEKQGEIHAAKQLAKSFLQDARPYVRALGLFHLGRLSMAEENWLLAEQYFQRAASLGEHLREIPLYLQVCASKMGKQVAHAALVQP